MDEPNLTPEPSLDDYATRLPHMTARCLNEELERNRWLMEYTQLSEIDYAGRYSVCVMEIANRYVRGA